MTPGATLSAAPPTTPGVTAPEDAALLLLGFQAVSSGAVTPSVVGGAGVKDALAERHSVTFHNIASSMPAG